MEELKKEMDTAYKLISTILVRGDAAEVMSEARQHLRAAYKLAETMETADPEAQDG